MNAKSQAERQADRRKKMRRDGFVLKQYWVHPDDEEQVRKYIDSKIKKRLKT